MLVILRLHRPSIEWLWGVTIMNFNFLTIVAIYGNTDGHEALPAIRKSMGELPGSRGLLISIKEPTGLPASIKWQKILPMDYR